MFRILLSIVCLSVVAGNVSARSISAIYFQAPQGAPEKVFLHGEAVSIMLPVPQMNLVDPVKLPPGELTLRVTTEPTTKERPISPNAPSVKIPAAWTDVILLFASNPKNQAFPFSVEAMNVSTSEFKPGELMVFNRSNATVGGKVGDRTMKVGSGRTVKVESPSGKEGDYRALIGYQAANDTRARTLCDTTWRHEATMRHLLFILPDPDRGVPRIWSVGVRPPPVEKEK